MLNSLWQYEHKTVKMAPKDRAKAKGPARPPVVLVIALLTQCIPLQEVVVMVRFPVAEFLVLLEPTWPLLDFDLAVRHLHFWEVLMVEQPAMTLGFSTTWFGV